MTDEYSSNAESSKRSSKFRRSALNALSQAYGMSSDIATENNRPGSKSNMAARTAALLLNKGLDKAGASGVDSPNLRLPPLGSSLFEIVADSLDSDENDSSDPSTPTEESRRSFLNNGDNKKQADHFTDILLDKFISNIIPKNNKSKRKLPKNDNKPNFSIRIVAKNFKNLSSRLDILYKLQSGITQIVTWSRPTATLTALVIYTSICCYPYLILVYPLLAVIYGAIIPNYLYRHPINKSPIIPVKKRGQAVFDFLLVSQKSHKANKDNNFQSPKPSVNEATDDLLSPVSSERQNSQNQRQAETTKEESEEPTSSKVNSTSKKLKKQMKLLRNMRDLQNMSTDVISTYDQVEDFFYVTAGFEDEKSSTELFFNFLKMIFCVLFFGAFIPWRLIFIAVGWSLVIICHPKTMKTIDKVIKLYFPQNTIIPHRLPPKLPPRIIENKSIILDESPEIREVEIFELEEQGLTPLQWNPYCFTTEIFDPNCELRASQQIPEGSSMIAEILPPVENWEFDSEKNWELDKDNLWVTDREIKDVKISSDDGWVYDIEKREEDGFIGRWRRRRWVRDCYRYARPPRKPSRK
ncbi:hypothetical protein PACTADRAFT_35303 [Pachysolen tannophilus NRRL Y-2460]|uniref:TECPR1-like DysF domain-containing protein n=1 Tax=Pachysolen tannophilus NRRL Y-2460 TaxID=669874 RepID=A0A1E4TS07_PACTA|nr:hypothetical protein PACTADRAFT_35303 [Pachysolen tannophilus NRRL Y-2460]